jgi:hypothetical protein
MATEEDVSKASLARSAACSTEYSLPSGANTVGGREEYFSLLLESKVDTASTLSMIKFQIRKTVVGKRRG